MRILVITYQFPPVGGVAVQRALSFAKYLPRHGHTVHVLTTRNPSAPVFDASLLQHLPPEVSVHRTFTPEVPFDLKKKLWKWVSAPNGGAHAAVGQPPAHRSSKKPLLAGLIQRALSPDPQVVWTPFAYRAASRIVRTQAIDVVLVTAPPFSAFLIGNALKRKFPRLKLVSDFRDEWFRFFLSDLEFFRNEGIRRHAEAIEEATVARSDLVLTVTRSSLAEMHRRYGQQPAAKFVFLANGYDPDVFSDFRSRSHDGKRLVVVHAGTVYRTSSPRYYFEALRGLPAAIRNQIETRFVGRVAEEERPALEMIEGHVRLLGFRPQPEALREMEEADYLLLTMTNDFSLPGKLFEYLATGKKILALSPPGGEVARLLQETGAGVCFPHDDPVPLRRFLANAVEQRPVGSNQRTRVGEAIGRYARPELARELSDVLRQKLLQSHDGDTRRRALAEALAAGRTERNQKALG